MKKTLLTGFIALIASTPILAGGLLTNTNQSISFLRNPSRDATISIDGVYSNPAGTAFLEKGLHLSANWQIAIQKRQITSLNPLYTLNTNNNSPERFFQGKAMAPVIPSFQAVYNFNNKWTISAQFAIAGGGGECKFHNGLAMFEKLIANKLISAKATSYSLRQHITGEQYHYGFQIGSTFRVKDFFSVFAGVRGILADCSYKGQITDIQANGINASQYLNGVSIAAKAAAEKYASLGMIEEANAYKAAAISAAQGAYLMKEDFKLDCIQMGFGFTPIIGVDFKYKNLNIAAKYEFRTKINMKNESLNSENVDMIFPTYKNGNHVRTDIPALVTAGVRYEIIPSVRVSAGFHYYWDKDAKGTPIIKGDNTWETNLGAEWDINKHVLISVGVQRTEYGFADSDMNDLSFNNNSTSLGIGGSYTFNKRIKLNIGYMHTFYNKHTVTINAKSSDTYNRKNDVFGLGIDLKF